MALRTSLPLALGVLLLAGCTSSGAFIASNQTNVLLSESNYVVAATNVSGEAESGYLLGFSYAPSGLIANTIALVRVSGSDALYKDAIENLWANYEKENGSPEGQSLALTNIRYDSDILNLFLYTKVKVSVRADIIRFKE